MIDPLRGAGKPRLKRRCVFSEIVEEAGEPRCSGDTDALA